VSAVPSAVVAGTGAAAAAFGAAVALVGWPSEARSSTRATPPSSRRGALDRATVACLAALGRPVPDATARRHLRWWSAIVVVAALGAPVTAVPVAVAGWAWARRRRHRSEREHRRAVARTLPDAVDLLALCTRAGVALPIAHGLVAPRLETPIGPALAAAAAEAAAGRSRADALTDALGPLGDRAATLAHVLAEHLRYGVPLEPALDRLGVELRADRRRQAEEDARRVPVRLLGPLVACVLPAFALLTVVPLLAASLRALPS
jgi:tight adherence protein C